MLGLSAGVLTVDRHNEVSNKPFTKATADRFARKIAAKKAMINKLNREIFVKKTMTARLTKVIANQKTVVARQAKVIAHQRVGKRQHSTSKQARGPKSPGPSSGTLVL